MIFDIMITEESVFVWGIVGAIAKDILRPEEIRGAQRKKATRAIAKAFLDMKALGPNELTIFVIVRVIRYFISGLIAVAVLKAFTEDLGNKRPLLATVVGFAAWPIIERLSKGVEFLFPKPALQAS